jgi:hypothetical protein
MDRIQNLTREINKIVTAPYAMSLKVRDDYISYCQVINQTCVTQLLLRILEQTSTNDLHIWAHIKACQILPLVAKILRSIPTDRRALPVLRNLVRAEKIRNELLTYQPSALQEVFFPETEGYVRLEELLCWFNADR